METLSIYVDFVLTPEALDLLRRGAAPHNLVFPAKPATSVLTRAESDGSINCAQVAFGQPDPNWVLQAPKMKWVHVSSSGITRYDTAQFRSGVADRKLAVTNSATVYSEPCAVHALSFILAQARRLPEALETRVENGSPEWHHLRGISRTLRGETAVIIGYGAIGRRLAELLAPFGMNVSAYRRNRRGDETVTVLTSGELPAALAKADHVVNILPDSPETRGFFGPDRLAQIKPGAVFYNIGRGTTADQDALLQALRTGKLAAAWLDVTDPEPLPYEHPLRLEPNCFITPHVAGGHPAESLSLVRHFLKNLERFTRQMPLLDRVM